MSLPTAQTAPPQARFVHENGTQLRMQCFVAVRDSEGRVATLRIQGYDGWCLPGESMLLNESPDQAAVRVARSWFQTPLGLQLDRIISFPATGPEDDRWYLLFVYHADAPAGRVLSAAGAADPNAPPGLAGTADTLDIVFRGKDDAPEAWAMSHADVWPQLW